MGQFEYSYSNQKRDLTDMLSIIIAKKPSFISFFPTVADATQRKHEWLEDQITPRSITVVSIATLTITASAADVASLLVGTTLNIAGDPALFRVTVLDSSTTFTVELAAANGSTTTAPSAADVMGINSTPQIEGSSNANGEQQYRESDTNYNQTQIMRKLVQLSRTSIGINTYGLENKLAVQLDFAMQQVARDLNRIAFFGARVAGTPGVKGECGGLYTFATDLEIDASSSTLDNFLINDASQAITDQGGTPSLIICSPGQARVLSALNTDKVRIIREDRGRGDYVASVTNDMNGSTQTIVADYDMIDTQAWVLDPAGLGLSNFSNGRLSDEDTTTKGFDGVQRTILGEMTLEFKNAAQRYCKITDLTDSATALTAIRNAS